MFNSLRLGAASIFVLGALTAGCAGPTGTTSSSASLFTPTDDMSEVVQKRDYRSKCDDLDDNVQRMDCFRFEQDDAQKDKEGYPG